MTTRTPQDYALEACPFCGSKAHFEIDDQRWEWIECESCAMQGNRSASLMEDCKPKLAEAWNRRAPQAGWLPISEAPKQQVSQDGSNHYGEYLLVWCPGAPRPFRARWWWRDDREASNFINDGGWPVVPTAFQHLPLPPSTKGEPHAN